MQDFPAALETVAELLDGLGVGLCLFDEADRTLLWNRSFLRFFPEHEGHIHVGEPYRANLRRFYDVRLMPEEMGAVERYIEQAVQRHREQQRPYNFVHRGVYLQVTSLPLAGVGRLRVWRQAPQPHLSDLPLSDIISQQPRDTPPSPHDLFENVGDAVLVTDAANRISWINQHFVRLFGLDAKTQAVGLEFVEAYARLWQGVDEAMPEVRRAWLGEQLRFAGAPFELELPGQRWVRVIEQRRPDGVGYFALVDITRLKQQQRELVQAERRARASEALLAEKSRVLEATLERMEQGVVSVSGQGTVEVCNRRAIELLGLSVATASSRPSLAQLLEGRLAGAAPAWLLGDTAAQDPDALAPDRWRKQQLETCDGRLLEVQSAPIDGGGVLHTFSDITGRREAERRQQALEAQLREAQRLEALGTLAGGIAHDFNNIVAGMLGNVAFAQEALDAAHLAQRYLERIRSGGLRARNLVHEILSFSRPQGETLHVVPLQPLLEEVAGLLRGIAGERVQLQAMSTDAALAVRGNATQLQQVLMNLGTNACQALPGGVGRVEIGLQACDVAEGGAPAAVPTLPPGRYACLWVHDDGVGMDEATRRRMFEPFFTTKPVGQGTGLGLAVVRSIVEAHGGRIGAISAASEGSRFEIYLPRIEAAAEPEAAPAAPASRLGGRGQRVLYVDDDEVVAIMVQEMLCRHGYAAEHVVDPQAAIARVRSEPGSFDLVVTDYNMPGLTGLDVARALAAIRPDLPVAISTGYVTDELRSSAAALGVRALMQKERTLEELAGIVFALLAPAAAEGGEA